MPRSICRLALLLSLFAPMASTAEQLTIPIGQTATAVSSDMPQRGDTKAAVTSRYGQPLKLSEGVGSPPIARWDYPAFSVYFETDRVLHAVQRKGSEQD